VEPSSTSNNDVIKRLQRMEGQVRGVRRMIEENRDCNDVLTQLAAIRGALHQISILVVQDHAMNCLNSPEQYGSPDEAIVKLVKALGQIPH
jgi:DNA-binding FrmR family transcriptional regulator